MKHQGTGIFRAACAGLALVAGLAAGPARAVDTDIFAGNTTSTSSKPNIMILVDNSANWSRSSQQWPDTSGNQGESELLAMKNVLTSLTISANVGFAGYAGSGSNEAGYIRFGLRDMTVAANKTALVNILDFIRSDVNSSSEKVNNAMETTAMYEIYKYYKRLPVYTGTYTSGNDPRSNVDITGNNGNPSNGSNKFTAYAQGLTSGFAYTGSTYNGPVTDSCGQNYLIMVINNAQGAMPTGSGTYQSTTAASSISSVGNTVGQLSWTDEWARFLYQNGISVFIMDAYNKQQNTDYSAMMEQAATVAGGQYYAVKNQADIELAFKDIFAQIVGTNSNFASASLPISSANRSESLNQVYIGMFRPNTNPDPRWMGNLKRYRLVSTTAAVSLADSQTSLTTPQAAVDATTGFVAQCAVSYWTLDSGTYWSDAINNQIRKGTCATMPTVAGVTGQAFSDLPDGPIVEKGGVAEVMRRGNNPPTSYPPSTTPSPTYSSIARTIYTYDAASSTKLSAVTTSNTGWSSTLLDWAKGYDDQQVVTTGGIDTNPYSEWITMQASGTKYARPSIHGDVVHSRPLPVNYGSSTVTVFYGANDGYFRAVDSDTGKEKWAFIATEHLSQMQRLHDNSPPINFPNVSASLNPKAKDYFFDGNIGQYQKKDNSKIYIYPSMRRGGRMVYGFDVTTSTTPSLLFKIGCTTSSSDSGCTSGFSAMGLSWSTPVVAFLKGYSSTNPVLIFGGGYDTCEDTDSTSTSCSSGSLLVSGQARKGNVVYVVDATTGTKLKEFTGFGGSVVSDVTLLDGNSDGFVDFGYVTTTNGELWRLDFANSSYVEKTCTGSDCGVFTSRKIANTNITYRKLLFAPSILRSSSKVYVTFGSGDREHPLNTNYPYTTPVTNRFYMYLDDLTVTSGTATNLDTDANMLNVSTSTDATCTSEKVTPTSTRKGWFMDLPNRGEQVVTSSLIASGMVTFNTNRAMDSTDACTNPLGEARGYWVNLLNASGAIGVGTATCGGDRSSVFTGGGFPANPTLSTVPVDGKDETVVIGAAQRTGGSSSMIAPQRVKPAIASKRKTVYWKSNLAE